MDKPVIGWREWVSLPDLAVSRIKAKIDTGARTSALHAFDIEVCEKNGQDWVRFTVHPYQKNDTEIQTCTCPVRDMRIITNSGGFQERRIVIITQLSIGQESWPIELTLTNRDEMGFRMLLGRTAIKGRFMVDPGKSFRYKNTETHHLHPPH